ncbi:hypothetical protein ACFV7R_45740 [Streptomyces sp. NPDC059866]|uniref:hypothetical protein n=1 Tax=Streptomyces sp. NPDC059866 TaxID=3346978 RepID=UPI0036468E3E
MLRLRRAPVLKPVSATRLETARPRGSALLDGLLLLAGVSAGPSLMPSVHALCHFTDRF